MTTPKPKCIIITGPPGSGKSTLARALGRELVLPVLSRDELMEGYIQTQGIAHSELPDPPNGVVTPIFFEVLELMLSRGISVIAEAAFQHHVWQPQFSMISHQSNPIFVVCACNPRVATDRRIARAAESPSRTFFHGDSTLERSLDASTVKWGTYVAPKLEAATMTLNTEDSREIMVHQVQRWLEKVWPGVRKRESSHG